MSKYVKNLISDHLKHRLEGVENALLVNLIGLSANANNQLRADLSEKGIQLLVVKNSMAKRALEGTPLDGMFDGVTGSSAVCWGEEDLVAIAKEIVKYAKNPEFEAFQLRGGVLDGGRLSQEEAIAVSKWPSREELLATISGQISGVGATLSGQLIGPGGALASQISQKAEGEDGEDGEEASPADEEG